jgi:hypothetical protein
MLHLVLGYTCLSLIVNTAMASIVGEKWISRPGSSDFVLHRNVFGYESAGWYSFSPLAARDRDVKNYETGDVVIQAKPYRSWFNWFFGFLSPSGVRLLDAATKEELFSIEPATILLHSFRLPTYYVMRGYKTLATVRKSYFVFSSDSEFCIYEGRTSFNPFTNTASTKLLMTMRQNNQISTAFHKGYNGEKVAWAHEKLFSIARFFGGDDYAVHVEKGNDVALVLASMIIRDGRAEEFQERRSEV